MKHLPVLPHPDLPDMFPQAFGYWRTPDRRVKHDVLPDPAEYVDPTWEHGLRVQAAWALLYGPNVRQAAIWLGHATCRFCGQHLGSRCLTDGVYAWPEGLAHVVREHGVIPPEAWLKTLKTQV